MENISAQTIIRSFDKCGVTADFNKEIPRGIRLVILLGVRANNMVRRRVCQGYSNQRFTALTTMIVVS